MLPSLLRSPRLVLSLLIAVLAPATARALGSVAEWDELMARHNPDGGVPVVTKNWMPDDDNYAWAAWFWIQGYLSLAQATGEARYMDAAKSVLDHMLANRDDIRFADKPLDRIYYYAPTYYLFHEGKPAPGWRRRYSGAKTHAQVSVLIDGRICEIFLRWCELARRSFPQYEADVARYLDRVHETIEMHQPSFREIDPAGNFGPDSIYTPERPAGGFRHWWHDNKLVDKPTSPEPRIYSGQLPLNHSATMASAMFAYDRLRGTSVYREKVQLVVNYVLNSFDPARPDRAIWQYDPVNPRRHDIEDIGHAAISLPLLQEAYRDGGFGVTAEHMRRLTNTYLGLFDEETGFPHRYIDGTEKPGETPTETYGMRSAACFYGWLWFSQFDPAVLVKARRAYEAYFGDRYSSGFNMGGWANLLYWEKVRDGTAAIPDLAPPLAPASAPSTR